MIFLSEIKVRGNLVINQQFEGGFVDKNKKKKRKKVARKPLRAQIKIFYNPTAPYRNSPPHLM